MSKIFASFSGGRSSAYMCHLLLAKYPKADIQFVFANTGQEHPKTLEFTQKCDEHFKLNLVWVEAVVHPGRVGTTHRVVDFKTASRDGTPYRDTVAKFGIANKNFPHCTREMKLRPMYSYIKSIGWTEGSYKKALGIRADEPDRLSKTAEKNHIFYPLAEAGVTKADVLDFWAKMPFDLGIQEREGNCLWCFKKSERKLCQNIAANPEWFKFPAELERRYAHIRMPDDSTPEPRFIFRGGRSTGELMASVPKDMVVNPEQVKACADDGCSESCEVPFEEETA
jgi:hypothetical protein